MSYKLILVGLLYLFASNMYSQDSYPDCIHPKTIKIPLSVNNKIDETIYYQTDDKYSFWYKIDVVSDGIFNYELTSLNESDDYDVLIYNYNGESFCNDVVLKNQKPFEHNIKGRLNVKKGEVYYFSILHLTGEACGHNFKVKSDEKEMVVKAIQNECVEEVMETIIVEEIKSNAVILPPVALSKDSIKTEKVTIKSSSVFNGIVVNKNSQQNIDAVITVTNNDGDVREIIASIDSGFTLSKLEIGSFITINKLGYETFKDTIRLLDKSYKIELTPIKVGDKIIMNKIYFHPNTYVLKDESKPELVQLKEFMLENSNYYFEIQGHTNGNRMIKKMERYSHLGEEWNFKGSSKKLSKLRAEKIKKYLVAQGVSENQLQTEGYGGDKMIIEKPKNMKQAMKNIRVEVVVIQ